MTVSPQKRSPIAPLVLRTVDGGSERRVRRRGSALSGSPEEVLGYRIEIDPYRYDSKVI